MLVVFICDTFTREFKIKGTSKLTRQMTMITHSNRVLHYRCEKEWSCHKPIYHAWSLSSSGEFKLIINFIDILFKFVYKYLRNIIIVKFFYKSNWLLTIECIVKTLYVVTKFAGRVFLILIGVSLLRVWLTCWQLWCEGFKISIYNEWDSHWPIVIFKRYFKFLIGKFNFYSFVWFTILTMRC